MRNGKPLNLDELVTGSPQIRVTVKGIEYLRARLLPAPSSAIAA